MRQLWREGSQHHRVQSVSQLPHLEMLFQPQLGVLTGTFIPVSPAGIRGSGPPWPPCTVFCARSKTQPHSIWKGWTRADVMESEPLDLPVLTAALLRGTKPEHSSFYLGVKGVQHRVSQFWLLCTVHTIPSILTQYNNLLFPCTTHQTVSTEMY